jgi:hypothetical protein
MLPAMASAATVLRGGALGDLLLTLPLLHALRVRGRTVRVLTRASHAALLGPELADAVGDLERLGARLLAGNRDPELREWFEGAELLAFVADRDGRLRERARACGAQGVRFLESRPRLPPHVSLRMLRDAGLRADSGLLVRSHLAREARGAGVLWLHPGSGSPKKNAPLEDYASLASRWSGPVVVSLGEAELDEQDRYRRAFRARAELLIPPTLAELRARLEREAAAFVGNDSGPTHAIFVCTDPGVWRPVGTDVRVIRAGSELRDGWWSRAQPSTSGTASAHQSAASSAAQRSSATPVFTISGTVT